ncbi:MAG: DUF4474 domain-containing protein [Firmicutes bacterium]|nr:DUF4474 domain-containing protein [Bacillota bacterium]
MMKTGRKGFPRRLFALALILALMFALPLSVQAAPEAEAAAPAEAAVPVTPVVPSGFWSVVGLPSLRYWPSEEYLFHTKYAYQWLFGFNAAYDTLSPVAGCFYDTVRFKFNYGGRDWMVQAWKGTYGYGLFTGGELGLYNKPEWSPLEQYQGATTSDWIGMEFSIYSRQTKLFTRPMENTWWVTGFKRYIMQDWSREFCSMEGALRFPNAEMAAACAQAMAAKGFIPGSTVLDRSYSTDRYSVSGNTVRFLWREKTEM